MDTVRITSGEVHPFAFANGATSISAPATSAAAYKNSPEATYQLISAAAATCIIEVTNEAATAEGTNSNWITAGTITIAGAGTDGFTTAAPWKYVRARVTVASAATSVLAGV